MSGILSGLFRNTRRCLVGAIILIILIGISYASLWAVAYKSLSLEFSLEEDQIIRVSHGQGLISIINELTKRGLIASPQRIKLAYYIYGLPSNLQQGEYAISDAMKLKDLIDNIASGKQRLHRIRIDIGVTFYDFYQKLMAHPRITKTTINMTTADIMNHLGTDYRNPEGLFYADTYFFHAGEKDITILQRAHKRLNEVLDRQWQQRKKDLIYHDRYEALIMASIIEKETALDSERSLIAGVFQNRLRRGMRLQTDPTVIYGMGTRYKGNISRGDLNEKTPYNTYIIYGLPPTPIALVDERTIKAALNPKKSDYIFFVAKADGTGAHYFSVTYEEHRKAVAKYQLRRK